MESRTATATVTVPAPPFESLMAERPSWRGRLHTWTFFVGIPAGLVLVLFAQGTAARVAAAVYVASVLAVFGTSAAYHRLAQSPRARALMQRLDHSMIYLLIAGTYVPICVVALPPSWGVPLLVVVGSGAAVGMALKLFAFGRVRWLGYALYPMLGWTAVLAAPALVRSLELTALLLVVAGGLAYTIGIPVLVRRRPDPWPRTFGYHEIWHSFTVVAAGLHFVAVGSLVW